MLSEKMKKLKELTELYDLQKDNYENINEILGKSGLKLKDDKDERMADEVEKEIDSILKELTESGEIEDIK